MLAGGPFGPHEDLARSERRIVVGDRLDRIGAGKGEALRHGATPARAPSRCADGARPKEWSATGSPVIMHSRANQPGEARLVEGPHGPHEIGVAVAGKPAVAVGEMDVADEVAGFRERGREVRLLDVHVIEICHDADAGGADRLAELGAVPDGVEILRLVAVERFEEDPGFRPFRGRDRVREDARGEFGRHLAGIGPRRQVGHGRAAGGSAGR